MGEFGRLRLTDLTLDEGVAVLAEALAYHIEKARRSQGELGTFRQAFLWEFSKELWSN